MKKYLPYANYLAAAAGVAGALLRRWMLSAGADEKGLYPAAHPGGIGYVLVMLLAVAAIFLLTRDCGKNSTWRTNFPGGTLPLAGQLAAAVALLLVGIPQLSLARTLQTVNAALAVGSGVALAIASVLQFQKKNDFGILYLLPCLYFALQLFLLGKGKSNETQLLLYLPQVLAFAFSALASYELIRFSADIGNRSKSLFWSLSAAALCLAAAPGGNWYFLPLALWHLLSHCTLTEPAEEAVAPVDTDEPTA